MTTRPSLSDEQIERMLKTMGRSFKGGQIEEMEPIIGAGNLNNQFKRANSILAPGEKAFTQQELNDMVQYLMVNRANNSEHVKVKKSSKN